jgi:hypothetical protein
MRNSFINSPLAEMTNLTPAGSASTKRRSSLTTRQEVEQDIESGSFKQMFFDSIGIQFHFSAFWWQLAAHLILPLFPFMANLRGQFNTRLYTVTTPILSYFVPIAYFFCAPGQNGMHGAFLIPLVYYFQHRLVIAMKYGSLSRTEYKRFQDCQEQSMLDNYNSQMQLGTAWLAFHPSVLHFELAASSAKIGARINDIDIYIHNPAASKSALNSLRTWNAYLRGQEVIDYDSVPCKQLRRMPDGSYRLSVYDLCEGLLMASAVDNNEQRVFTSKAILVFNMLNLLIPIIVLACSVNSNISVFNACMMALFCIGSSILNFVYARTFYVLLYIAIIDANRQCKMVCQLNCMIRLTDVMLHANLTSLETSKVTIAEMRGVEQRVAEIVSIKGSQDHRQGIYGNVHENPDDGMFDQFYPFEQCSITNDASQQAEAARGGGEVEVGVGGEEVINGLRKNCKDINAVLGEHIYRDNETYLLPRVCFDVPGNVVGWTHARLTIQYFGERFRFRLELYVIAAIAMMLAMMALGLFQMSLAKNRYKLFFEPWFLQTLLSVLMCIGFLIIIMEKGAEINEKLEQHSQSLCAHSLRVYRKIERLQLDLEVETDDAKRTCLAKQIETMQAAGEKIDGMTAVVDTNTSMKPYKVFGFVASSQLTMSIITTAVSFFGILVTMLSSRDGAVVSSLGEVI